MKSLQQYINDQLITESVTKNLDDMYSCGTVDHKAATFSKSDIQECLKKIREYKKLDNIQVTAWDQKSPRTTAYKYEGAEDNTLIFKAQDNDEFVNKNLYGVLMNDLAAIDNDIVIVKFDKCKWIQSLSVYQDDFYSKDSYILAFEG